MPEGSNAVKRFFAVLFLAVLVSCGNGDASVEKGNASQNDATKSSVPQEGSGEQVKSQESAQPRRTADTGSIIGEVKFKGPFPGRDKLTITKDGSVCDPSGSGKLSERLIVGLNGGLQNAVVSVDSPAAAQPQSAPVILTQDKCQFSPHVLLVPAGGKVEVLNPDGILHNFHTHSSKNPAVNKAQPKFLKKMSFQFDHPEKFKIVCDAHQWMEGWIVVTEHSHYSLTDANGSFKLSGVPAGKVTIRVWHETLGEIFKTVDVPAGKEAKVVFDMTK